jgi:hypothetical protein
VCLHANGTELRTQIFRGGLVLEKALRQGAPRCPS